MHPITYIEIIKILLKLEKPSIIKNYICEIFLFILK